MFIQWRHNTITGSSGKWSDDATRPGLKSHRATLLRSDRVDGKVRKTTIANLGYFTTKHGVLTEHDADEFWRRAMRTLDRADVTEDDQAKAAAQLAEVVRSFVEATASTP